MIDPLFEEVVAESIEVIRETGRASTSALQRRLRIGYILAARIMDELEKRGIVGPINGAEPRKVLNLENAQPQKGHTEP
jgi:S-DNA-T family DNA segregation ATPase FtsK/SpoIIIE